ncbi:DUF2062 domain-containing protein [Nitrospira lenta]|uniref:DUF2062 domain-containing protein n=1 Tax=Nitrospira lenta TaxID=1436998 RepID=A0A330L9Y0_9BACT|nr:DUF2062 domain-containing protein [Nitrospira lenta]SPP65664.1 conserved membrane hypothetical protein [Nitrospira lenta]
MGERTSFRTLLRQVLHLQEPPQRTALAFALGVFVAFCPAYGFHMILVGLFTWLFRLNFVALLAGALINNPWTIAPILGLTYWSGALLIGQTDTPAFDWQDLSFSGLYQQMLPYALPFTLGGIVLSLVGSLLAYPAACYFISKYRRSCSPSPCDPAPLPPHDPLR